MRKRIKLVVVGDGFCGKTCLLIAFCTDEFPSGYVPTVFETYVTEFQLEGEAETIKLALFDTAGQEDYDRLRPLSYTDADVIAICFSLVNSDTLANVSEKWLPEVAHFCPRKPFLLVGTKKDLHSAASTTPAERNNNEASGGTSTVDPSDRDTEQEQPVDTAEALKFSRAAGAYAYVECSAKTREGLRTVFETAARAVIDHERRNPVRHRWPCKFL